MGTESVKPKANTRYELYQKTWLLGEQENLGECIFVRQFGLLIETSVIPGDRRKDIFTKNNVRHFSS